jgi:hypothetical protein
MDTNGWDTVFVADISQINLSLLGSVSRLLPNFQFEDPSSAFYAMGELGNWQIVPGGSGSLLFLQITIANGTLADAGHIYDTSGLQLVYKVALNLMPAPDLPQNQQLRFHFRAFADDVTTNDGTIALVKTTDPSGKLTTVQAAGIGSAVGKALVEGANQVSFIFATINPLAASGIDWLVPQQSTYSYADVVGSDRHWLGILSVNSGRPISGLSTTIDPSLLGPGQTVGLALSEGLFEAHMLIPALASALQTSPNYFGFANTAKGPGVVSNTPFDLPAVHDAGESYTPHITAVEAVIKDTNLELGISGTCAMGMNITMTFTSSAVLQATYSSASNGVTFTTVGSPTFDKSVDVPWYDRLLDACGLVGAIIFETTVATIGSELGSSIGNATNLGNLGSKAPALVNWLERTGFTPTDGGLATSFYLRGQL